MVALNAEELRGGGGGGPLCFALFICQQKVETLWAQKKTKNTNNDINGRGQK